MGGEEWRGGAGRGWAMGRIFCRPANVSCGTSMKLPKKWRELSDRYKADSKNAYVARKYKFASQLWSFVPMVNHLIAKSLPHLFI